MKDIHKEQQAYIHNFLLSFQFTCCCFQRVKFRVSSRDGILVDFTERILAQLFTTLTSTVHPMLTEKILKNLTKQNLGSVTLRTFSQPTRQEPSQNSAVPVNKLRLGSGADHPSRPAPKAHFCLENKLVNVCWVFIPRCPCIFATFCQSLLHRK